MKRTNHGVTVEKMALSAMFLALCMILPFFTGQVPQFGKMFLPMHLPVFLCGLVCGWQWGLCIGAIAPVLRSMVFGMPLLYPTAISMAFELAVYGSVTGALYHISRRRTVPRICGCLLVAMICGRVVSAVVQAILMGVSGQTFTLRAYLVGTVLYALPGIALQLILIPTVIHILQKRQLIH